MGCCTNSGKKPNMRNRWKSWEEPMSETSQGFTRQDDNTLDKYCITFIEDDMIRILFRDIFANSYLFPTLHSKRRKRVFSEDTYLKAPMNYCRSTFFHRAVWKSQLSVLLLRSLIEGSEQKTQENISWWAQTSVD